ncbi:DUF397 domain-containing protein [Bounagaea algeriensis]
MSSAVWRKSSRSNGGGAQCVEVGFAFEARGVRDSKLGEGSPVLAFERVAWSRFLSSVKNGSFDL